MNKKKPSDSNSMHLKCTQVPLSLIADNPLNKNFLFEAQSIKGLKKMILKQGKAADEAVKELMDKNKVDTLYHICNLCLKQAGLQKIKMCAKRQVLLIYVFKGECQL